MSPDDLLRLEGLTVRYGGFTAVDRLDLAVKPGELFGLLGPNGAGKSSTLRVLIGQRRPSAGRVRIAGLDVVADWQRVKSLFGYVPDRENHFEEFSGRRNLQFFAGLYGVHHSRIDDCLNLVELSEAADLPVRGYSLGMRRKLLLARALLHRPRLLYLDEPTANLDVHSTELVHRLLRRLAADGVSVLLTTHNMKEVEDICDRVGILCRGRLIALDSPLALRRRHTEHKADATLTTGERLVFDLDSGDDRARLASHVAAGEVAQVRTCEFDFHQTFLKLTGEHFDAPPLRRSSIFRSLFRRFHSKNGQPA
jgi:ABC-type multidrug transport system ATPase subunit